MMKDYEVFFIIVQVIILLVQLWIRAEIKALDVKIKSICDRVCNLERKVYKTNS